jgi:hypothetical protein
MALADLFSTPRSSAKSVPRTDSISDHSAMHCATLIAMLERFIMDSAPLKQTATLDLTLESGFISMILDSSHMAKKPDRTGLKGVKLLIRFVGKSAAGDA